MNITDEMLYAAAPEAAERWLDTLPGREDCGHNFSLTFEASMASLLRRRRKRRWRRSCTPTERPSPHGGRTKSGNSSGGG